MPDSTVLVVEDFDDTRAMIRMLLEMKGCQVLEAVNGREAVEAASVHCSEIDLILMDLRMPVMTGVEAPDAYANSPRLAACPSWRCPHTARGVGGMRRSRPAP